MHVKFGVRVTIKHMIQSTQSKALSLRIMNFKQSMEPFEFLYQKLKINKLKNILNNCLFVFDKLTSNFSDVFDQVFQPLKEQHNHSNRRAQQYLLNIPKTNTQMFGSNSIIIKSIKDWNEIICKIHFNFELLS